MSTAYPNFKIVGDNIDKYMKPRDVMADEQASVLHYFNIHAVHDRLDMLQLPDSPSLPDISAIRVEQILPTEEVHKILLYPTSPSWSAV